MSSFSTLEIDPIAFEDIKAQLLKAGYDHTANYQLGETPTIVMDGLAVQPRPGAAALSAAPTAWVPVTQELLESQEPWLYTPCWLALNGGSVLQGYYEWRQGRNPDRFCTNGGGDLWAFDVSHVMPIKPPAHPSSEPRLLAGRVSRDVPAEWFALLAEARQYVYDAEGYCVEPDLGEAVEAVDAMLAASPKPQPVQAQPSVRMWHDRIKDEHPTSDPQYWPNALKVEYMEREILDLRAMLAASPQPQPVCPTCSGHGMIGGPSFHAPDEGGVPCPDCNQPQPEQALPVDMILYCPHCGEQHIDAPEFKSDRRDAHPSPTGEDDPALSWANPPHRSHLCHGCGTIWRPSDVPTNGVHSLKTKGKADTWPIYAGEVTAHPATIDAETAAFKAYLADCDTHAIQPDVGGAFSWAWNNARNTAGAPR